MAARNFLRDSLGVALSHYLARGVLLARGVVSAAALGPASFGAWNALNLILDYGAYAPGGAQQGLDLRLPADAARGDRDSARQRMRGAWSVTLAGGALFAATVVIVLAFGTWVGRTGWGWGAPATMLAATFLQLAIHYHGSALRSHGDFTTVSVALSLQALVGGGLGVATVWTLGVWGLLGGWLLGSALALLWLRRGAVRPPLRPGEPREGIALARLGLPLFAFFGLALVLRSLDRIALVRFGGDEVLGQYSLGLIAAGLVLYLPEAAAAVLYPRIAAAASGARDPVQTRGEVVRAQRALAVLLPPVVGLGLLWAEPVIAGLLPAFQEGLPALRILALGALLLSAGTLPAYFLLGTGQARALLAVAGAAVAVAAAAVFGVVLRDPRAAPVAVASTIAYGTFSMAVVLLAASRLAGPRRGLRLVLASLVPALWTGLWTLALAGHGGASAPQAAWQSAIFVVAYAPLLILYGRGLGLREALAPWREGSSRG